MVCNGCYVGSIVAQMQPGLCAHTVSQCRDRAYYAGSCLACARAPIHGRHQGRAVGVSAGVLRIFSSEDAECTAQNESWTSILCGSAREFQKGQEGGSSVRLCIIVGPGCVYTS